MKYMSSNSNPSSTLASEVTNNLTSLPFHKNRTKRNPCIRYLHPYTTSISHEYNYNQLQNPSFPTQNRLGLRREGQRFIRSIIGNGLSMFLWLDNWYTLGTPQPEIR